MIPRLLGRLVAMALAALRATLRVQVLHGEHYERLRERRVPMLFVLWHGRMLLPIQRHRRQGIVTMASQSKDGEIIASWLERNGYVVVRGSSTRGGSQAFREMVRQVRSGRHAALTVDGPKGPPRVVQPGVVPLARLTGAWILPITSSCSRPKFLRSWDRYLVPLPFSRAVVAYGEPFPIEASVSEETALCRIASVLDQATEEADDSCAITPPPTGGKGSSGKGRRSSGGSRSVAAKERDFTGEIAVPLRALLRQPGTRGERGRRAAEWIRARRGYRWVGIYDVTEEEIAAFAWTGETPPAFPRFPRSQGLSGAAVQTGEPIIVPDVRKDPRYLVTFASTGSEAIFPIRNRRGKIVGTLDVESERVNVFTQEDRALLEECAVGVAGLWSDG